MADVERLPLLDLPGMHAPLMDEIKREIGRVIDSHAFALGPEVQAFEAEFAAFIDTEHCVGVNNGTSALHLALLCAGVRPGSEVITTPMSWVSTSWAISYVGATPVFVDIDPQTGCLDPAGIAQAITRKTAAILPVHLYGHPADMDAIAAIARQKNIPLIEDAAQAHGARCHGEPCGSLADIATFSFYPGKNLGAFGEAGAITTRNAEWAERARALRDHAQAGRHRHVEIGFNYRMDGIQAAVLRVKMRHLDSWNAQRRHAALTYGRLLKDIPHITLPPAAEWAQPVWHIYALQAADRERLREHLKASGIDTAVHYPTPIHLQPAYADLGHHEGDFPHAERLAAEEISLPMYPGLQDAQIERVARVIREFENSAVCASA